MKNAKRIIPVVILLVVALGGYYLYVTNRLTFPTGAPASSNIASGFIEGDEVSIASEVNARIATISVDEGDAVAKDQEIVLLDRAMLDAQISQAQAQLAQATAARDGAKRAWDNAVAVRANPQELNARIAAAEAQVNITQYQRDAARANATSAETQKDAVGGMAISPQQKVLMNNWYAAQSTLAAAQAAYDGAQNNLAVLQDMRARPLAQDTQVDAAKAQYDTASTAVDVARAALGVLQVQSNKMTLKSPVNGIVSRRAAHAGEIAAPNSNLLSVTNLESVKLTIYVPETQIGAIKIGDEISVSVDSFPGKQFKGKVVFISTQAEFTPRNVQTQAERVNTVFAVRVQIPNPNLELKPGMPADARLKLRALLP
jgi:membrane fusion protein YbhG